MQYVVNDVMLLCAPHACTLLLQMMERFVGVITDVTFYCGSVTVEVEMESPQEIIEPEVSIQLQIAAIQQELPPYNSSITVESISVWHIVNGASMSKSPEKLLIKIARVAAKVLRLTNFHLSQSYVYSRAFR